MRTGLRVFQRMLAGGLILSGLAVPVGRAQDVSTTVQQTFQFGNFADGTSMKEIQVALRNILIPSAKVTMSQDDHTVSIETTPDEMLLAQRLLRDLKVAPTDAKTSTASEIFPTNLKTRRHVQDLVLQTYYLPEISSAKANAMMVKLHSTPELRATRIYFILSRSAVMVRGTTEELVEVQKSIAESNPGWNVDTPGAASSKEAQKVGADADALAEQTIYLVDAPTAHYEEEVLVAMRNMLDPSTKIFLVRSSNAVVLLAPEDQLKLARKVASDLDVNRAGS